MNDKIVVFIDLWFLHFGISKFLKEKWDGEIYAILDVEEKARKFFEKQKIVNFQKVWYYLDHVSKNTKVDYDYLKKFEERYGISLWNIAFSERLFYQYNPFHKFRDFEILSIIEQEIKFYESILDEIKPDYLALMVPTSHHQQLLFEICKARGIRILMLTPVRFANRIMISEDVNVISGFKGKIIKETKGTKTFEELQSYLKKYDSSQKIDEVKKKGFESHIFERYKAILKFFFSSQTPSFKKRYSGIGKTRSKYFCIKFSNFFKKKIRTSFINKNFLYKINSDTPFIYFPLHFEPERVLLMDNARYYSNQIAIITNIAKSLLVGYKLLVKEHPAMKIGGWRDISFYKQIMDLPNVYMVHPSVSSEEVIKKCSLLITIAGTSAIEATFYNKPSISFTDQIYCILPSIHRIKTLEELPFAIKKSLKVKIEPSDLEEYIRLIDENSFEFNIFGISSDFAYRFGLKGAIMDVELSESKVRQFLKDYSDEFKKLAIEHIKKLSSDNVLLK